MYIACFLSSNIIKCNDDDDEDKDNDDDADEAYV